MWQWATADEFVGSLAAPDRGQKSVDADRSEERIASETSTMPPVGELLTAAQIADVVAYLRSLQADGER